MKILSFLVMAALGTVADPGTEMDSSEVEAENLLNEVLAIADERLLENDEFESFAAALRVAGDTVVLTATRKEMLSDPAYNEITALLDNLRAGVEADEFRATAIAYYVRIHLPGETEETDAIAVALDHIDAMSVDVYLPYKFIDGFPVYGEAVAQPGAGTMFGQPPAPLQQKPAPDDEF